LLSLLLDLIGVIRHIKNSGEEERMHGQRVLMDYKTHILRLLSKASVLLSLFLIAFPAMGQDVCRDYTEWLRAHPADKADPNGGYRKELIRRGMSADQADAQLLAIWKSIVYCPEGSALSFDRVYRWEKLPFTTKPNAFLVEMVRDLKPGHALDVAMGQGRNSIYLAEKGWDVTGFDVSSEGLALARKGAGQAGVKIKIVQQGWADFDFGSKKWDLIVLTYAWVPVNDRSFIKRLCSSLRLGGLVIHESALFDAGSPAGIHPQELLKDFQNDLRILRYEETTAISDWDNRKKEPIVRMLARK
jgi:SAM-dependent methyltransferase